jgi:hypothetical protein
MDAMTLIREDAVGEARVEDAWRERRPGRCRMFKPAQIAFDGLVLDCVLLDASPEGAQVHLKAPADVPDLVSLRFPGGESRTMRRCWQRGARIGFEVVGTAPLMH